MCLLCYQKLNFSVHHHKIIIWLYFLQKNSLSYSLIPYDNIFGILINLSLWILPRWTFYWLLRKVGWKQLHAMHFCCNFIFFCRGGREREFILIYFQINYIFLHTSATTCLLSSTLLLLEATTIYFRSDFNARSR